MVEDTELDAIEKLLIESVRCPTPPQITRVNQLNLQHNMTNKGVSVKPGLWTGLDYGLDWTGLD